MGEGEVMAAVRSFHSPCGQPGPDPSLFKSGVESGPPGWESPPVPASS